MMFSYPLVNLNNTTLFISKQQSFVTIPYQLACILANKHSREIEINQPAFPSHSKYNHSTVSLSAAEVRHEWNAVCLLIME